MWYSILPEGLTELEGWIIRFFLILGTLTIGPWIVIVVYDILLYIWRASTYEIPIIGGRARGRHRPVAPTLSERPDGRRRVLSLTGIELDGNDGNDNGDGAARVGQDVSEAKKPDGVGLQDGLKDRRAQSQGNAINREDENKER